MLDAWRKRTRDGLARAPKLLSLPEQEFPGFALARIVKPHSGEAMGYATTLVCGEPGSGKTALVQQALRHGSKNGRSKAVVAEAAEWLRWVKLADDKGKPRLAADKVDLAVCEAVDAITDSDEAEQLASWLDTARQGGIPVILTASRWPGQMRDLSPRLRNRLRGGMVSAIRPLSAENQRRLIEFWRSQDLVPATAPTGRIPAAITTAGRLRAWLTGTMRSPGAANAMSSESAAISLELVADLVASDFQVPVEELCSDSRSHSTQRPRQVAMALARELTGRSLSQIGRHFGGRSHSSVARSCGRLQELLPDAPTLRQQVQQLRIRLRRQLSAECG
jgi:chromosomal replication initiator protein